jgi:DNA-binding MarR family transcriptional regulator
MALGRLDRDGPTTTSALAAADHVRPQSMAATLASLHKKGLVRRTDDLQDRRQIFVNVTETGLKILAETRKSYEDWLTRTMSTFLVQEEQEIIIKAVPLLDYLVESDLPPTTL